MAPGVAVRVCFRYGKSVEKQVRDRGWLDFGVCFVTEYRSLRAHRKKQSHAQSLFEEERVTAGRSRREGR